MSVMIQLVCEDCGRQSDRVVISGAAPRGAIENLRADMHRTAGWERSRRATDTTRDLCKGCAEKLLARMRQGR